MSKTDVKEAQVPRQREEKRAAVRSRALVTLGRGNKGKSLTLREMIERAVHLRILGKYSRDIVVLDLDPGNRTLAEALRTRPESQLTLLEPQDVTPEARVDLISHAVSMGEAEPAAIFIDVGANDRSVSAYAGSGGGDAAAVGGVYADVFESLDSFGTLDVTVMYLMGNEPADVQQLSYVLGSKLASRDLILCLNEGAARRDYVAAGNDPFAEVRSHPLFQEAVTRGARVLELPAMPSAASVPLLHSPVTFVQAMRGEPVNGEVLSPWTRQAIQLHLSEVESRIVAAGVQDWLL